MRSALDFMQMLWRVNHALEQLSKRMETRLGITAQQRMVIRWIGKHEGITAGALAGHLHLDAGTVSAALARMERRGLVVRRRHPGDGRRVVVGLTAAGKRLDRPARSTVEAAVEELLELVNARDVEIAMRVLAELTHALDERSGD